MALVRKYSKLLTLKEEEFDESSESQESVSEDSDGFSKITSQPDKTYKNVSRSSKLTSYFDEPFKRA